MNEKFVAILSRYSLHLKKLCVMELYSHMHTAVLAGEEVGKLKEIFQRDQAVQSQRNNLLVTVLPFRF